VVTPSGAGRRSPRMSQTGPGRRDGRHAGANQCHAFYFAQRPEATHPRRRLRVGEDNLEKKENQGKILPLLR
jgi:hypothetical protein